MNEYEVLTDEEIIKLLEEREYKQLKEELSHMYPVDIAEILRDFDDKQTIMIFRLLGKEDAAETFTCLNSDRREILINSMTDSEVEEVMEEMYIDDTVDVLEEMPANVVDRLLMATDENTRKQINELLKYPEDCAGSIMNVEYCGLRRDMTVAEAILKIRQVGIDKETIYTLYVTEKRKLLGAVSMKDLLTSSDDKIIEDIMDTNIMTVNTLDDQEDVVKLVRKYGLMAVPVIDHETCMVGIVTVDDAMYVQQEETTEDMSLMAAVSPTENSYFETSVWEHTKNRSVWLLLLMFSATITQLILGNFENQLSVMPLLVTFMPMITDTGGNCGSQSSTLIIRGLALDEIEFSDFFKVVFKEIRVATLVSLLLAVINGIRILLVYHNLVLAVVIGLSLAATIIMAKMIGCMLPMLASKIGLDPAIMAGPLITTIVDCCSILLYFVIATHMLNL